MVKTIVKNPRLRQTVLRNLPPFSLIPHLFPCVFLKRSMRHEGWNYLETVAGFTLKRTK